MESNVSADFLRCVVAFLSAACVLALFLPPATTADRLPVNSTFELLAEVLPEIETRLTEKKLAAEGQAVNTAGQTCGRSRYSDAGSMWLPSPRIVGGMDARNYEFPWQALLGINKAGQWYRCGASLLNDRWLVTAAHCICEDATGRILATQIDVSLGQNRQPSGFAQTFKVDRSGMYSHPDYDGHVGNGNDIALLRVNAPVRLDGDVAPICLPPDATNQYEHRKAVISGWGLTTNAGNMSEFLRYATVNVMTNGYCSRALSRTITANEVCATDNVNDTERGICGGDSGGPLAVQESDGTFYLVGVASNLKPRTQDDVCATGFPGVFTRVSSFLPWIYGYIGIRGEATACSSTNIDLVFIVDASDKSSSTGWQSMLSFVNAVVDRFTIGQNAVRVAFIRYAEARTVYYINPWFSDKNYIKQLIATSSLIGGQSSNLHVAFDVALIHTFSKARPDATWVAVVVTNNPATSSDQQALTSANNAKAAGIEIIPVGINEAGRHPRDLYGFFDMASDYKLYVAADYDTLRDAAGRIACFACAPTTTTTTTVATTTPTTTSTTTPTRAPPSGAYCSVTNFEIAFVVDSSSKSDSSAWPSMLTFVNSVIEKFDVGPNAVRVAFVHYGSETSLAFNLNSYTNRNSLKSAVSRIQPLGGGSSDLPRALDVVRQQVLTNYNVRPNSLKILISLVDRLYAPNVNGLQTAIENCRSAGFRMYGAGIAYLQGRPLDSSSLYQLSFNADQSNPWQATWVYGYNDLPNRVDQLANYACVGGTIS